MYTYSFKIGFKNKRRIRVTALCTDLDGYMSWFLSTVEMCMDMKYEMKNRI